MQKIRERSRQVIRMARIFARPGALAFSLRQEWRRRLGVELDRRFRPGSSGGPTNVQLLLTYRCNLRCRMCLQVKQENLSASPAPWHDTRLEMSPQEWERILKQLRRYHPVLYVTGGEPTLYPHFEEVMTAAKRLGMVVHLQTNGTQLEKYADLIVRLGVEIVTVSVDGPAGIHDEIRGVRGCHARIQRGMDALLAARASRKSAHPFVTFNCTLSKTNYPWMEESVRGAQRMGADSLQFQHPIFQTAEQVSRHNRFFGPERSVCQNVDILQPSIGADSVYQTDITAEDVPLLKTSLGNARRVADEFGMMVRIMPTVEDGLLDAYYGDIGYPFAAQGCDFFWRTLRVTPDGSCAPCFNMNMGSLREKTVDEIWNSPQMGDARRYFADHLAPGCARCCRRRFVSRTS